MATTKDTTTKDGSLLVKHISAENGQPSTFYSADNGKTWYRKKNQALGIDKGTAVNPDDYVYEKTFWAQNKKTILVCTLIVILIALLFYAWHKGAITFHIHKH